MKLSQNECYRLEQLAIFFEHLEYSIGEVEDEYGNYFITPRSLNTIYRCLFSAWFRNLDSHVYLRSINKVRIYPCPGSSKQ